jgi:hypothetical protein
MMRDRMKAGLLLAILGLAGCGESGGSDLADPKDLAPLTEADKAEIKAQDAKIELEERGTPVYGPKTKKR